MSLPGSRNIPIVIVGNKKDHYNGREVSTEEGKALATSLGCEFFETSAKTNANVENCFKCVVREIKQLRKGPSSNNGIGPGGGQRRQKKKCLIL
jgi:GTPase KRas protein